MVHDSMFMDKHPLTPYEVVDAGEGAPLAEVCPAMKLYHAVPDQILPLYVWLAEINRG